MCFVARLTSFLAACGVCLAVPFTISSTYTITTGGLAFVHTAATATTITTAPIAPVPNQIWTVAIDTTSNSATVQNVGTLAYMATNAAQITPSAQPFFWTLATSGSHTSFCIGGVLCVMFSPNSTALLLSPSASASSNNQLFTGLPAIPPRGAYSIQSVATSEIIATDFVPGACNTAGFPAFDRSEIWLVGPNPNSPSLLSLQNFDSAGFIGLTPGQGNTVGTWTRDTAFIWDAAFEDGVGLVLLAQGGAISASTSPLSLGSIDSRAAWIFHPVDANAFLP